MPGQLRVSVPYVEITKLPAVLQEAGEKNIFPCYRVKVSQGKAFAQADEVNGGTFVPLERTTFNALQLGKHSDAGKSYTKLPSGNVSTNSHNHKMVYHGLPMEALRDRFVVEAVDMKRGCEHVQIGSCAVDIAQILDEAFFTNEATGHKMHIQLCNGGERVGTACVYVYYHIDEEAARKLAPNVRPSLYRQCSATVLLKLGASNRCAGPKFVQAMC